MINASQLIAKSGLVTKSGVFEKRDIAAGLCVHQLTVYRQSARVLPHPSDGAGDCGVPALIIEEHWMIVVMFSFLHGQPGKRGVIVVRSPHDAVRHTIEVAAIVLARAVAGPVVCVKECETVGECL